MPFCPRQQVNSQMSSSGRTTGIQQKGNILYERVDEGLPDTKPYGVTSAGGRQRARVEAGRRLDLLEMEFALPAISNPWNTKGKSKIDNWDRIQPVPKRFVWRK